MKLLRQLTFLALANTILAAPCSKHQKVAQTTTPVPLPPGCSRQAEHIVICTKTVVVDEQITVTSATSIVPTTPPAPPPTTTTSSSTTPAPPPPPPSTTPALSIVPTPLPSSSDVVVPTSAAVVVAVTNTVAAVPSASGSSGGVGNYMSVVSQYRAAAGLGPLIEDPQLEANALKTMDLQVPGGGMVHKLYPGSFGQVIWEGSGDGTFTEAYIGGWLCEIANLPGLNGVCSKYLDKPQDYDYQHLVWPTSGPAPPWGHAYILADLGGTKHTKIGCANQHKDGVGYIWICDVA